MVYPVRLRVYPNRTLPSGIFKKESELIAYKTAIESLLRVQGFKVIKIPKFLKICDIGIFIKIYITLSSEKGIEQLGNTLNKTSLRIFNSLTQNIDKNEDIFKIIGNVTNIIFDVEAE